MKNFFVFIVLFLMIISNAFSKNKFIEQFNFYDLPKPIIQDKVIYLGISYDGKPNKLLNIVEILLNHLEDEYKYTKEKRYVIRAGCKPRDCGNKGLLWIDLEKKVAVGVITHTFWEKLDFAKAKKGQIFIYSNFFESSKELPEEFIKIYNLWVEKNAIKPSILRFLNSKNEIRIISAIKNEKLQKNKKRY